MILLEHSASELKHTVPVQQRVRVLCISRGRKQKDQHLHSYKHHPDQGEECFLVGAGFGVMFGGWPEVLKKEVYEQECVAVLCL